MDLALNNQQWLICHKTKPNQTKPNPSAQTGCNTRSVFKWILPGLKFP